MIRQGFTKQNKAKKVIKRIEQNNGTNSNIMRHEKNKLKGRK
jgi:hypothetical protein